MAPQVIVINDQRFVLVSEHEYVELLSLRNIENNESPTLNTALKQKREELGLTIIEMSQFLGITPAQICRLEKGQTPNTKTKNLLKLKLQI